MNRRRFLAVLGSGAAVASSPSLPSQFHPAASSFASGPNMGDLMVRYLEPAMLAIANDIDRQVLRFARHHAADFGPRVT